MSKPSEKASKRPAIRAAPPLPLAGEGRGLVEWGTVVPWKRPPPRSGLFHRIGPMLDWSQCPAVERSPDRVSGAWVFRGTRVPVAALFENLESGARVEEFLEWFPGVSREQAEAVLEHAARSLVA